MTRRERYTRAEHRALLAAHRAGSVLKCPTCGSPLDRRPVPSRPDVAYVRDRLWVSCPRCQRDSILDSREGR